MILQLCFPMLVRVILFSYPPLPLPLASKFHMFSHERQMGILQQQKRKARPSVLPLLQRTRTRKSKPFIIMAATSVRHSSGPFGKVCPSTIKKHAHFSPRNKKTSFTCKLQRKLASKFLFSAILKYIVMVSWMEQHFTDLLKKVEE